MTTTFRPRRLPEVAVHPAPDRPNVHVLKDTRQFRYVRLSEPGLFVWSLMDGERTLEELALAYRERYGRDGAAAVLATVRALQAGGLVEPPAADAPPRRRRLTALESLVSRTFSVPDPDRALRLLYRLALRPLYHPFAQVGLLAIALAGGALNVHALASGGLGSTSMSAAALSVLAAFELQVALHELAHAVTTKHFGREVHRLGIGWYLLSPVAFVDTSDMWLEGRRRRIVVAAAGPYANVVLAGLAGILLPLTGGGGGHAFLVAFSTTGYGLALVNLNPLYELDGYYVLSDWLGIANLRAKSLAYLGARARRRQVPAPPRRLRRIYVVYGAAAAAYAVVAAAALLLAYHRLLAHAAVAALPHGAASTLGWLPAGAFAGLLLLNLWRLLRAAA
ncbi:MAG TPA: PqqD family peptide modification chaperone [Gaiellaceae bacterium]